MMSSVWPLGGAFTHMQKPGSWECRCTEESERMLPLCAARSYHSVRLSWCISINAGQSSRKVKCHETLFKIKWKISKWFSFKNVVNNQAVTSTRPVMGRWPQFDLGQLKTGGVSGYDNTEIFQMSDGMKHEIERFYLPFCFKSSGE